MSDSNFDGVLDPDAGWPDIPQASTQFVVLGGQGGPLNEQAKNLAARTKKLKEDIENISGGGFGGQYKNLVVTVSGVGYQGTITADRLIVESGDFKAKVLRNINVAFNGSNVGINGIDSSNMSSGNWYCLYVIYNPITDSIASLISLSATSPTLPAGYTEFAMVGYARVLTATTAFVQAVQKGRLVRYGTASAAGSIQIVSSGILTAVTSVSTSVAVPPGATCVKLIVSGDTSGTTTIYDSAGIQATNKFGGQNYPYSLDIESIDNSSIKYQVAKGSAPTNIFIMGYSL